MTSSRAAILNSLGNCFAPFSTALRAIRQSISNNPPKRPRLVVGSNDSGAVGEKKEETEEDSGSGWSLDISDPGKSSIESKSGVTTDGDHGSDTSRDDTESAPSGDPDEALTQHLRQIIHFTKISTNMTPSLPSLCLGPDYMISRTISSLANVVGEMGSTELGAESVGGLFSRIDAKYTKKNDSSEFTQKEAEWLAGAAHGLGALLQEPWKCKVGLERSTKHPSVSMPNLVEEVRAGLSEELLSMTMADLRKTSISGGTCSVTRSQRTNDAGEDPDSSSVLSVIT